MENIGFMGLMSEPEQDPVEALAEMDQIERISMMEELLDEARAAIDRLDEALTRYSSVQEKLDELDMYYGSELWMKDFEDDEEGKLPQDLKRGVLTEDEIYDLMVDDRELNARMLEIVAEGIRG